MSSLSRELTLGLETGVFRWRVRKYGTNLPATLRQPDVDLGQFKRLSKTFLFGEAAAH